MHDHQIEGMIQALIHANLVPDLKRVQAAAILSRCWKGKVALTWTIADIRLMIPNVTKVEANKVLRELLRRHDNDVGMCWETIKIYGELQRENNNPRQPTQNKNESEGRHQGSSIDS